MSTLNHYLENFIWVSNIFGYVSIMYFYQLNLYVNWFLAPFTQSTNSSLVIIITGQIEKQSLNAQKIIHYLSVTIHYLLPNHVCSLEGEILFHLRKISTKFMTIHFLVLYHSNSEYNIQYSEYREHWVFFSKKFPLIQIWW